MNKLLLLLFLGFILTGSSAVTNGYRRIPLESFAQGEVIKYRVHYGFLTAGEATMVVDNKIHKLNDRACYKIDVFGRTSGLADKLYGVDDNWGTFLDTSAVIPHKFYRYIKEGNYRKNEVINFDQLERRALLNKLDKHTSELKEVEEFEVPKNVQDMVSGYYFLRTLDFTRLKKGQVIKVDAFFDGETYNFKIRFLGREEVKTKIGNKTAVVLQPIMPENKVFSGEDPITVWISDDEHKIPLRIRANMFIGGVEVDIKEYTEGSRHKK